MSLKFGLIGCAGYIAPRHFKAIKEIGGELVAACDPCTSVGILDSYGLNVQYFPQTETFNNYIKDNKVDWVSICSPNYLHVEHCIMAMRSGANIICEKPLVLNLKDLYRLQDAEEETGKRVYSILQLRLHPELIKLKKSLTDKEMCKVNLNYITARGPWYNQTWKADLNKSGGISTNIGIHLFDLMIWLFGDYHYVNKSFSDSKNIFGHITLGRALVDFMLSTDYNKLPDRIKQSNQRAFREITIDNTPVEFSNGFTDLHTLSYQEILNGNGFGLNTVRPSIELVNKLR